MTVFSATTAVLIGLGASAAFLTGLARLVEPGKKEHRRLLSALFFSLFLLLLYVFLLQGERFLDLGGFFYLHIPAIYLLGPLTLTYYCGVTRRGYRPGRLMRAGFLVPFTVLVITVFVYAGQSGRILGDLLGYYRGREMTFFDIITVGGFCHNFLYYLPVFRDALPFVSARGLRGIPGRVLLFHLAVCSLACVLAVTSVLTIRKFLLDLTGALIGVLVVVSFLLSVRYPELMDALAEEIQARRSPLEGADIADIGVRLDEAMMTGGLYRDPDLTLDALADRMGLSRHQLSHYLNRHRGMNFNRFLNELRVREAMALLAADRDRTVLAIAFEVGFNSKSSFNEVFQRLSGMTPTEYRKSIP